MNLSYVDIATAVLDHLKDAEYHSIVATTLHVGKYFHLSNIDMNESYISRKSNISNFNLTKTKIYTQTVIAVSNLRKTKFLKDFPGTKSKGFFIITEKGLNLLKNDHDVIKKQLYFELNKYYKEKRSTHN